MPSSNKQVNLTNPIDNSFTPLDLALSIQNSKIPTLICNTTGIIVLANAAAGDLFGYTPAEIRGINQNELFREEKNDIQNEIQVITENEFFRAELTAIKKNGEKFSCEILSSFFDTDGESYLIVIVCDISNSSTKKMNERFYFATQATSDIIWDWDLSKNTILWAKNFTKILGHQLPPDCTLPFDFCLQNIHPEDRERISKSLSKAISNASNEKWENEFRYRRSNGSYAYVIDRGYIIRNNSGKAIRMIGALHDITKSKYQRDLLNLELRLFEISSLPHNSFKDVVNELLEGIEKIHPEMYSSVVLLKDDDTIESFAGPRIPEEYSKLINGLPISPVTGSCGTAMYKKEAVIVSDIQSDPLWQTAKNIAEQFELKACWSIPIIHSNGKVLGSFALYYKTPKKPSEQEWSTILRINNFMRLLFENKLSVDEIKLSNERYNIVTNATHDLIWDWNLETNQVYRDPKGLKKVYGFSSNEPIKRLNDWLKQIHPDDHEKVQKTIFDILNAKDENTFDIEYRFKKENGEYAWIYDRGYMLRNEDGKAYRMIGAAQDITERKKLEQEVQNYQKAINQATISIQEKERAEIGKELHDNVNQVLTTTKLYLDLAQANTELKDEMIEKSLKNIIIAIDEIRQLSRSLMSPSLGDLGLIDSIEDLVEDINATKKVLVNFVAAKIAENTLTQNQKLTLFRITQECLSNIIRHSEATNATVELYLTDKKIVLKISDNGKGFNHSLIKKGAGLNNIRNRVYLENGTLSINTQPGKGCNLVVELPFSN
ncbi:MAG: hypothetical protein C4308_04775 [Chitinophagaceae bacterium]